MKRKNRYIAPLFVLASLLTGEVIDRVVAVVGDEAVTQRELDRAFYTDSLGLMRANPLTGEPAREMDKGEYLDRLIEQKVIGQEIKRQGIKVEDMEVERAVTRKRESLGLTEDEFAQALSLQGLTLEDYRKMVREQLTTYRLISQEVRGEIEVTDEEVRAYYLQHPEEFYDQDKYHLRLIFLRFSVADGATVRAETVARLEGIRAEIQKGADFAEMAKQHSQATTAASGGDIGWFELSEMLDLFAEQAKKLGPRQMSPVFSDATGAYLLYCEDIKKGELLPLEQVRDQIFEVLYEREAMERYNLWLERLKARTYIENRLTEQPDKAGKP